MSLILTDDEAYDAYVRGRETRRYAAEIVRLHEKAKRARVPTRSELTPVLQTDAERAEGATRNAQMERLLKGKKPRSLFRRIFHLSVILAMLAGAVQAQEPKRDKFRWFNKADAVYWAGAFADVGTSINKREANPLWRDAEGIFSPGKNLAFKAGLWSGFKLLEAKYTKPSERRLISWFKIGVGAVFAGFAIRNAGIPKAR